MVGIISVVIGDHFGGGDHFDGGDHFGGGTGVRVQAPRGIFLDFNSLKSLFLGFRVFQTGYWQVLFTLDEALQLGKFFIY